jgi:hypothetical protein
VDLPGMAELAKAVSKTDRPNVQNRSLLLYLEAHKFGARNALLKAKPNARYCLLATVCMEYGRHFSGAAYEAASLAP